jgi:hypothetical protein
MGGTIGWRAIRRRPCTRLGFAGLRVRFHWLWPCAVCVRARSVPVRDVRQAVPDVLPAPGDAWRGFRPALSPASRLAVVAAQRGLRVLLLRALLRVRLAFQAAALRLRQAWFAGCPAVPDDPVHATRAAASRSDNKRESRKQPGRRLCFHCHDFLSVLKNVRADAGEGKVLVSICLAWMQVLAGGDWGFCRMSEIR